MNKNQTKILTGLLGAVSMAEEMYELDAATRAYKEGMESAQYQSFRQFSILCANAHERDAVCAFLHTQNCFAHGNEGQRVVEGTYKNYFNACTVIFVRSPGYYSGFDHVPQDSELTISDPLNRFNAIRSMVHAGSTPDTLNQAEQAVDKLFEIADDLHSPAIRAVANKYEDKLDQADDPDQVVKLPYGYDDEAPYQCWAVQFQISARDQVCWLPDHPSGLRIPLAIILVADVDEDSEKFSIEHDGKKIILSAEVISLLQMRCEIYANQETRDLVEDIKQARNQLELDADLDSLFDILNEVLGATCRKVGQDALDGPSPFARRLLAHVQDQS